MVKDYFGLEIPIWMQSRKSLLLFFCFDFILFIFIKTDNLKIELHESTLSSAIILSSIWCLVSYVNGKYSYFKNQLYFVSKLYQLLKSTIICSILIYLLDKIIVYFYPEIIPFGKDRIFLLTYLSFIIQSIKLILYKIRGYRKKLYLIGNNQEINSFKNFLKEFPIYKNIDFLNFPYDNLKEFEKQSILILNEQLLSKEIKYKIINSNEVYTPFDWCEKYLNRIPNIYLIKKEFYKNEWVVDPDSFEWRLKRFGDITISFFLIILSMPIITISSFLIWIEDRGPIFYSQTRTGLSGKKFKLNKLRTMKHLSEKNGPVWASKNDKRITKIGSFLRKTRIDELPQLLAVLIGDMSLIGPRPERPEIEITLKEQIKFYELRTIIKPGLSGWAQVNYPYGASIKDSEIKLSYELFYIRNHSFWLDFLILIKTIKLIITMSGSKPK